MQVFQRVYLKFLFLMNRHKIQTIWRPVLWKLHFSLYQPSEFSPTLIHINSLPIPSLFPLDSVLCLLTLLTMTCGRLLLVTECNPRPRPASQKLLPSNMGRVGEGKDAVCRLILPLYCFDVCSGLNLGGMKRLRRKGKAVLPFSLNNRKTIFLKTTFKGT